MTMRRTNQKSTMRFQAELTAQDAAILQSLATQLGVRSNADFLAEALALVGWIARERSSGHRIVSLDERNTVRELVSPLIERVAPQHELPRIEIKWTERELESLAKLLSAEPAEPTQELIDGLKGR
jgi:hypothetical protein